eukprot:scaffold3556_cov67-Attheya_sp.AAC.7
MGSCAMLRELLLTCVTRRMDPVGTTVDSSLFSPSSSESEVCKVRAHSFLGWASIQKHSMASMHGCGSHMLLEFLSDPGTPAVSSRLLLRHLRL